MQIKLNTPEIVAVSQRFKFVTPASNPPAILLIDNATPKTSASEKLIVLDPSKSAFLDHVKFP